MGIELRIPQASGIPDGSLVSIRLGSVRRQAFFGSNYPTKPFKFPAINGNNELLRVDVFYPIARARLSLDADRESCIVPLMSVETSKCLPHMGVGCEVTGSATSMSLDLEMKNCAVCASEDTQIDETGEGVQAAVRDACDPKLRSAVRESSARRHRVAVEAQPYFQEHQLLEVLESLLRTIIVDRPLDPYAYMIQFLQQSKCQHLPSPSDNHPKHACSSSPAQPILANAQEESLPRLPSAIPTPPREKAGEECSQELSQEDWKEQKRKVVQDQMVEKSQVGELAGILSQCLAPEVALPMERDGMDNRKIELRSRAGQELLHHAQDGTLKAIVEKVAENETGTLPPSGLASMDECGSIVSDARDPLAGTENVAITDVLKDTIAQLTEVASLAAGDFVEVIEDVTYDSQAAAPILKGTRGHVLEMDGYGDAKVLFKNTGRIIWIPKASFGWLKKIEAPRPEYAILMPTSGWSKAMNYLHDLRTKTQQPSCNLLKEIGRESDFPTQIDHIDLVQHLLHTKLPQIFAESAVLGDGSDWNMKELSLLGDVSFAVPVRIFDNGAHTDPKLHSEPFDGTLLYTCGALLRPDSSSADWNELVNQDLTLNDQAYFELYERRLLPCFQYANDRAEKLGRQALITIPGLGCGQFAGRFQGTLGDKLSIVLQQILEKHGANWLGIHVVYFDAFKEGVTRREVIKGTTINYIEQPLGKSGSKGRCQLCRPKDYEGAVGGEGDDFSKCDLFSFVAWDHVSWPGNDYWCGSRATDDGVKAAATDSMYKLSGVEGSYDRTRKKYMPPDTFKSWDAVLKKNDIRLDLSMLKCEASRPQVCSNGHTLKKFAASNNGFGCDVCGKRLLSGSILYGCRLCNFDKCGDCCLQAALEPARCSVTPGAKKILTGLMANPEMNGKTCTVVKWEEGAEHWLVDLGGGRTLCCAVDNLMEPDIIE